VTTNRSLTHNRGCINPGTLQRVTVIDVERGRIDVGLRVTVHDGHQADLLKRGQMHRCKWDDPGTIAGELAELPPTIPA
jgi:hypothetical protein